MPGPESAPNIPERDRFIAWEKNTEAKESIFPGQGSFVFGLQRHSAFSFDKYPKVEVNHKLEDGNFLSTDQVEEVEVLGDAEPTFGDGKETGYYGPIGEEAHYKSLSIPGLSTERGLIETAKTGVDFAEELLKDKVPTHVIVVSSPSRWPNEEMIDKDIQHEFGKRTITTGVAFIKGVNSVAQDHPELLTVEKKIVEDERLAEAGYQYHYNPDGPGANKHFNLIDDIAQDIQSIEGGDGKPNRYFIENHQRIEAAAAALETRNSKQITEDIAEMVSEWYNDSAVQEMMASGTRVVVIGETHAQTAKSYAYHELGDDSALPTPGYRDSEMLLATIEEADDGRLVTKPLGITSYK